MTVTLAEVISFQNSVNASATFIVKASENNNYFFARAGNDGVTRTFNLIAKWEGYI